MRAVVEIITRRGDCDTLGNDYCNYIYKYHLLHVVSNPLLVDCERSEL